MERGEKNKLKLQRRLAKRFNSVKGDRKNIADFFAEFDKSGEGVLTTDELRSGLDSIGLVLSEREFRRVVRLWDQDGSGQIDYFEFAQSFRQVKALDDVLGDEELSSESDGSNDSSEHEDDGGGEGDDGLSHLAGLGSGAAGRTRAGRGSVGNGSKGTSIARMSVFQKSNVSLSPLLRRASISGVSDAKDDRNFRRREDVRRTSKGRRGSISKGSGGKRSRHSRRRSSVSGNPGRRGGSRKTRRRSSVDNGTILTVRRMSLSILDVEALTAAAGTGNLTELLNAK